MKPEEAIKKLREELEGQYEYLRARCFSDTYAWDQTEHKLLGMVALEKQIPLRYKYKPRDDQDGNLQLVLVCGKCEAQISKEDRYCNQCGQAIDRGECEQDVKEVP